MKYYFIIESPEYSKARRNLIPFDKRDIDTITKLSYSLNLDDVLYGKENSYGGNYNFKKHIYPNETNLIRLAGVGLDEYDFGYAYIYKNEDEWYYTAASKIGSKREKLYKCDQLDGLIKLMEFIFDENIIKESYQEEKSYKQISREEWFETNITQNLTNFTQNDIYLINKEGNKYEKWVNLVPWKGIINLPDKILANLKRSETSLDQTKLSTSVIQHPMNLENNLTVFSTKDEWYYIRVDRGPRSYFYKCDQIHGTIQCIHNIMDSN